MGLEAYVFPVGQLAANCVMLLDTETREAVLVDPGADAEETLLPNIRAHAANVVALVLTHAHFDHVGAASAVKEALPNHPPIISHEGDNSLFAMLPMQCRMFGVPPPDVPFPEKPDAALVDNGGVLDAVAGVQSAALKAGKVLHTPGHSQGSVSLYWAAEKLVLTGDTMFAGGYGRTDLPGGNGGQLWRSVATRLQTLPPETRVITGHGPETTIADESTNDWDSV
eukprot:m51a1_g686 hypothetical protein (225) ;mRNA; r:321595-322370